MSHARTPVSVKRDLEIVAWNANSISAKLEELREFLARHKPDVLLINETWLTPDKRISLPNYVSYRDDRQARNATAPVRGGTAIAVQTSIRHQRVPLPSTNRVEATAVELPGVLGGFLLGSVYNPPRSGQFVDDLSDIFAGHGKVILTGDLNSKHSDWGSRLVTASGRQLHNFTTSNHIQVIGPSHPTYYPLRRGAHPDVLDIAMAKGVTCLVQVFALAELSSDHCPIMVHVATQHTRARASRPVDDWNRFGPAFERRLPEQVPLGSVQLIDAASVAFEEAVTSATRACTSMKPNLTPDYHRILRKSVFSL